MSIASAILNSLSPATAVRVRVVGEGWSTADHEALASKLAAALEDWVANLQEVMPLKKIAEVKPGKEILGHLSGRLSDLTEMPTEVTGFGTERSVVTGDLHVMFRVRLDADAYETKAFDDLVGMLDDLAKGELDPPPTEFFGHKIAPPAYNPQNALTATVSCASAMSMSHYAMTSLMFSVSTSPLGGWMGTAKAKEPEGVLGEVWTDPEGTVKVWDGGKWVPLT